MNAKVAKKTTSRRGSMKTFAIYNVKGGVAKTTSATTIAHLLATEHKKKVLLVDLDPQSNTTSLFGSKHLDILEMLKKVFLQNDLEALKAYPLTVGDLLIDPALDVRDVIQKTAYENLDIIPAFLDLAEIEEQMKADIRTPQQFRLKAHIDKVKDEYDYCILDLSPSISIININGLAMTDYVFTPLRLDLWGIAGYCIAKNLISTVSTYNPNLKMGGCFFVQWNAQATLAKEVSEFMRTAMPKQYIDIPIRKCVKVEEMTYAHRALADYAKKATATEDYMKLTRYIKENF